MPDIAHRPLLSLLRRAYQWARDTAAYSDDLSYTVSDYFPHCLREEIVQARERKPWPPRPTVILRERTRCVIDLTRTSAYRHLPGVSPTRE